jgi:hypothetical protein
VSATSRRSGGASLLDPEIVLLWILIGLVTIVVAMITAAVHLAIALDGDDQRVPANPFTLMLELAKGTTPWPASATAALVAIVAMIVLLSSAGAVLYVRWRSRRTRVDRAASRMGRGRDLQPIGHKQAAATAQRLGVDRPGLMIARTVAGDDPLYQAGKTCRSTPIVVGRSCDVLLPQHRLRRGGA